jgi:hypothetical protein
MAALQLTTVGLEQLQELAEGHGRIKTLPTIHRVLGIAVALSCDSTLDVDFKVGQEVLESFTWIIRTIILAPWAPSRG